MNKTKFLYILVSILVLLNIGLISFLLLTKPPHPKHPVHQEHQRPKDILIKELNFDQEQIQKLDQMIADHRKTIKEKDEEFKKLKTALFESMGENDMKDSDSLIMEINKKQLEIEQTHFQHFRSLKQLCKGEQVSKFNALTKEFVHIFKPPHMQKPPAR